MRRGPDAGRPRRARQLLHPQGHRQQHVAPERIASSDARAQLGRRGEAIVCEWLEQRGFTVLACNVRVGRLELDVIARRRDLVVFCEVRSLSSDRLMSPAHTITRAKTERVRAAAASWLAQQSFRRVDIRFDAAAVVFDDDTPRVEYYEGAF